MQTEEFRRWLERKGYDARTINSRIGNCETVCRCEGDIDDHYDEDECNDLLRRLTYTTEDERNRRPTRHCIPINGNKRTGTSTLKSALNLYIKFRSGGAHEIRVAGQRVAGKNRLWPDWNMPTEEECYQLARTITKYLRFLAPEIVDAVVQDNEKNRGMFCDYLNEFGIDKELYLWEKSSCCFPGIRRAAGSSEIAALRGQSRVGTIEDAVGIDDNDYPKHLWSFIFRGQQFVKFGPNGYSLAHLIDHKKEKNRMVDEFVFTGGHVYQKPLYGLYSSPTNTVYTPTNLIRLTDFNGAVRNLLFRKAESLYQDVCNIVPPYVKVKGNDESRWNLSEFEWAEPVGTMDNVEAFLEDRQKKIRKILEKIRKK